MSNLEPIDDADLDLKSKFIEDVGKMKEGSGVEKADLSEKKEVATSASENIPERKEGASEKEEAYTKILSKVKTTTHPGDDTAIPKDAQSASEANGIEAKIETLIRLATAKGVVHAVKVARHLDDNYALDEFHDRLLAEELHDALIKKGLIKEI